VCFQTYLAAAPLSQMTHFKSRIGPLTKTPWQFAIRPSIRNNKEFTRDEVIKTIAAAVGSGHKVDLQGYDLLILVEIYQVR
jgi:hypothetical protein